MRTRAALNEALDELLVRARPLLVAVQNGPRGSGAGLLAGEGRVLTNHHVVARGEAFTVTLDDGRSFEARILARDADVDLALLGIPESGGPAAVFASALPRPGQMVFAFGHPWGQRAVLTGGVLSAVTSARTRSGEIPVLRSDVRLAPGNSGGPLLNAAGEVLGLNAMIFGGDQSIAIPASVILAFLERARDAMPAPREGVL